MSSLQRNPFSRPEKVFGAQSVASIRTHTHKHTEAEGERGGEEEGKSWLTV